jgi:hypothetical protein
VCTKPCCGLNTSRASLKANLAGILLDLGRKQKLSKSPDIRFRNRTTDDLPTEIQGKAFWLESQTEGRSAYHLKEGLYTYPVEYINGTWYKISWTIDECYEVSREDEIKDPHESGLGTKSQLFLLTPDLERIHTEITQGSDNTSEVKNTSPTSDLDIPTTDQAHAPVIEQLTAAMAAIAVAHVQLAQVAGPAQAPQPAGGQPAGGGQPQQPPAGGQPGAGGGGGGRGGGGGGGGGRGGGGGGGGQPAAGQAAVGQAAAAPPRNEALKGMIPQIFQGDRKDAERFMQQFGAYRFLNRHNSTFTNKAEQVAYAITFIKGPLVDNWSYDMADQLSIKVEGNPATGDPPTHAENDPALWEWFARAFRDAFTDSTKKQDAYSRLTKMELDVDKVDSSITLFKRLIREAGWGPDAEGTIKLFQDILPVGLHRVIRQRETLPATMEEWYDATRKTVQRWQDLNNNIGPKGGPGHISTRANRMRSYQKPSPLKRQKDPNAMDIDAIRTMGKLTDEEHTKLMKEGRCFRCRKLGHMSRACPDKGKGKIPDRPRSSQGQYTKEKPKVRATVINEDKEEEQHSEAETSTTAPPSYTKKDVLQYIRGMTIEDRENLYEELSAKADF